MTDVNLCVAGATGWTGSATADGALAAPDITLKSVVARRSAGQDLGAALGREAIGVPVFGEVAAALAERLQQVRDPRVDLPAEAVTGHPEARGRHDRRRADSLVRLPSFVVSTEVVFGLADERLSIRHDAGGTAVPYVTGVLLAVRRARGHVGLVRGLDRVLLGAA